MGKAILNRENLEGRPRGKKPSRVVPDEANSDVLHTPIITVNSNERVCLEVDAVRFPRAPKAAPELGARTERVWQMMQPVVITPTPSGPTGR
ncbi:hypothetical protein MAPG_00248 [Magnaporthiopsis poae ATCC 64411]|uniref:Uncharacterized protein n=1 Tax=Magnaporthiopsis poae (strain ATCC 64411 / 73-15) TaxID=644358 RepID=A0A0C4DKH5_MAGP6|nr:hypothetical protein MAPG_00248 [Magnaporthiopsis poae ATCC 64411]